MADSLAKRERETTHYLKTFVSEFLGLLSHHFKGQTTLNDLRIGNYIGLKSQYGGEPTNNKEISAVLGIPRSTVTRIVTDFIEQGWVAERPHPEDGRRKQLFIVPGHELGDSFEKEFRALLNELLELYESREIVKVDPSKPSF